MTADQLGVHRNPGRNHHAIPFVVGVQSNRFRDSNRRVVVPLVDAEAFGQAGSDIGPHFVIGGRTGVLAPLRITNVPLAALGPAVTSLNSEDGRIANALGALLSQAWR